MSDSTDTIAVDRAAAAPACAVTSEGNGKELMETESNIIDFKSRTRVRTYDEALTEQHDGIPAGEHNCQEWLANAVQRKHKLTESALRVSIIVYIMQARMGKYDWPAIELALRGLGYANHQLNDAIDQLVIAGLLHPGWSEKAAQ